MRWTLVASGARRRGWTNDARSGRRSRVVLTPRRRRQVCGSFSAGDGDKKARSPGRARRKPLKPLRREGRVISAVPSATTLVCFFISHARLRVQAAHPAFPAPSIFERRQIHASLGRFPRRENAEVCLNYARHCEEPTGHANARPMTGSATKQSILSLRGDMDCFACARNDGCNGMGCLKFESKARCVYASLSTVIARLGRAIQYSRRR